MGKKKDHLCKWKCEAIEKKRKKYYKYIKNPQFVCGKCGRVSNDRIYLCKPVSFK